MVISQTVTPGSKAAAGTTISITVSNGPKPEEKIDIQSFVGQQESALKSWASQNGLYTNVSDSQYSSSYAKGCIISMSPSSGNIQGRYDQLCGEPRGETTGADKWRNHRR